MATTLDTKPSNRGFFARLFSGHADMGDKYNVRVSFIRLFGKENRASVAWLWANSDGYRAQILAVALVSAILAFVGVRLALVSKDMLDAVQMGDLDRFVRAAVVLVCVTIAVQGGTIANNYFIERTRQRLLKGLRACFFHMIVSKDYGEVSRTSTQDLINRLMNDTNTVSDIIVGFPYKLAQSLTMFVTAIGVLFELEPVFIVVAVLSALPGLLMQRFTMPIVREFSQVERSINVRVEAFLQENVMQMSVVRAFGATPRAEQSAEGVFEARRAFSMDRRMWDSQMGVLRMLYGILVGTGLTIYCGYQILVGAMTFGSMAALITIFAQVRTPMKDLLSLIPQLVASFVNADRLREIESIESQVGEIASEQEALDFYREDLLAFGLEDAWFSYPAVARDSVETAEEDAAPRKPVLQGLTVSVGKGESLAITGTSGLGKSTIVKVLMGLYTLDSGTRFVETGAGKAPLDVRYQRLFAYVPQGNLLMRGTIREAVSFGTETDSSNDDALWRALRIACADDFILGFPEGLDTVLGELGSGLSEGQMQRISVARAVFSGHPILVLDEATSALDAETEERLVANLRNLEGRTIVVVAHRPAVVAMCDQNLHFGGEELERR
ncbi:MAG: ABC transporter ATP-binding protein [Eggerthellaceae bacterium]|nr:ABC transporter ATP-binding protein [Eggerthellaceae bacterium]